MLGRVREVRVGPSFIFIIFTSGSDTFAQSFDLRFFRRPSRLYDNVVIAFNGWWPLPRSRGCMQGLGSARNRSDVSHSGDAVCGAVT